ncbi:hypothetical protein FKP32DRAFT_1586202 [Trametes sanguinea]|nr:hypothetical protein FKP32DRAFT_1586202 [Trametes sanguinea]
MQRQQTTQCSLTELHLDVLILLLEEFRRTDFASLRNFSATCGMLREISMPTLFRTCMVASKVPITELFLPIELWPFVRTLYLLDRCPNQPVLCRRGVANNNAQLCSFYDPLFLSNALRNMPALVTVNLGMRSLMETRRASVAPHGIPWSTVQAVLSVPHLQSFALRFHRLASPWLFSGDPEIQLHSPSPRLTAFQYRLPAKQSDSEYREEGQALAVVLTAFHMTLRSLDLPIALLPMELLRSLEWPELQELHFHGERRSVEARYSLSDNMAALRAFDLKVSISSESDCVAEPIWSPAFGSGFPCQNLQRLSIAFPCPDDASFASLPPTLRELTLFCHPRKSLVKYDGSGHPDRWRQNLLHASALLRILQSCNLPWLRALGIEYRQDENEAQLIEIISTRFTMLVELVMIRYAHEQRASTLDSAVCTPLLG